MTLKIVPAMFAFAIAAAPLWADGHASGDAEAGEKAFKKCKSCHMIVDDAGETIVKGGKTGPNLWGLPGRTAGTLEGYKYGKSLAAAGEGGLVWDEAEFTAFVQNPKDYLQKRLDDKKARSKMSFKVKKGGEDIWAYIASVSPTPE